MKPYMLFTYFFPYPWLPNIRDCAFIAPYHHIGHV